MLLSPLARISRSADLAFEICGFDLPTPDRRLGPRSADRKTVPNPAKILPTKPHQAPRPARWTAIEKSGQDRTKADIWRHSSRERPLMGSSERFRSRVDRMDAARADAAVHPYGRLRKRF